MITSDGKVTESELYECFVATMHFYFFKNNDHDPTFPI